ncbi:MAG TPA: GTPase [Lacipirellulaceae bacterium]|jgi:tRNA modification GTPase
MSYDLDDTIAAIATAAAGAARGIVRVSGPRAVETVSQCFTAADGRPLNQFQRATAVAGQVSLTIDGLSPRQLPCDLFLWPTARSYTRQPVAEFHTVGSPPLLRALLATLCSGGVRLAEPGEFTLRAFLAGRIDLTQAEAVLGVIDAQQADQLQTALGQLAGGLAKPLQSLRDELLHLLAEVEAGLDFVEEDIEFISASELVARLHEILKTLRGVTAQLSSRNVDRAAAQVVLVGPPNAGKSSLFNAMTRRFPAAPSPAKRVTPSAIVSPHRGTTRDYLTAKIELAGTVCALVDTAGIEPIPANGCGDNGSDIPAAEISAAAQTLSSEIRGQASLRALCVDSSSIEADAIPHDILYDLLVITKADQASSSFTKLRDIAAVPIVVTSSVTGQGLDELRAAIRSLLNDGTMPDRGTILASTADRCRDILGAANTALASAVEAGHSNCGNELIAAELRAALSELGKVVGAVYTDDILDRIFSSFCIGK